MIPPHGFAASPLSPCCPSFAFSRGFTPLHAHEGVCHEVPHPLPCKHDAETGLYGTGIKILWRFWRGIGYDGEGKAECFPLGLVLKWILIE